MENKLTNLPEIVKSYIENVAQKQTKSEIKVVLKSESKLMKLIGWFFSVTKINPKFMQLYYTTLGSTIYIPDRAIGPEVNANVLLQVIIHECVHIKDNEKYGMLYNFSYLFPQILGLLAILSLLAIWFSSLWLLCLLFLVCFAPIPAWFRYYWERRAYRTSFLYTEDEGMRSEIRKWIIAELTTKYYYFTWPFPKWVDKDLQNMDFLSDPEYKQIKEFLDKNNSSL